MDANPKLNANQMLEIKDGLEKEIRLLALMQYKLYLVSNETNSFRIRK